MFALGYAARPLGAFVFGYIGDRIGRRRALMVSVMAMGSCTAVIAILPTFSQAGIAAPLLLVVLRIIQGISAGGEYSGASVYIAEHAPIHRRAFLTSFVQVGAMIGFVLGAAIGSTTASIIGESAMHAWGWRVPFAVGGVIAVVALVLRRNMPESPVGAAGAANAVSPILRVFRYHWRKMLHIGSIAVYASTTFYVVWVYTASYLEKTLHFSTVVTLNMYVVSLLMIIVVVPIAEWLSDKFGRRPFFFGFACAGMAFTWPLFWLLHQDSIALVLLGQLGFATIFGGVYGVMPATLAEILPADVRCSGSAIGYNVCVGIVGGTAPLLSTYLVAETGNILSPAGYLICLAGLQLVGAVFLKEKSGRPLER